ncbi:MAG: transglutaminase family protein [Nocardioides sp.]|uniref:transglutaminase family protein n=1 Tax=Nocardioides sp. TaxID=35761 RepID=UPI0039E6A18D
MTDYRVTHLTVYTYDDEVTDSFGVAHLIPRELPWQRVGRSELTLTPAPSDLSQDRDYYANAVTYFQVTEPHERLEIEAVSELGVEPPAYDELALAQPWESCRPLLTDRAGAWSATDLALASPLVEHVAEATDYAAESLRPGRGIGEAVEELMHRIHADFGYDDQATTVTSTVPEILAARGGVCQDFAHLMLACLRGHGLAARYVSGYLATTPPPGRERVVGADASHAWVAVWVPAPVPSVGQEQAPGSPEGQWLALDPTNDARVDDRYVTLAWGRDYGDVPPVKGVIFTEAKSSTLEVSVDVATAW